MKRYLVLIISVVLSLGSCYAQRKNNNVGKQTTAQTTPKKSTKKKSKSATVSKATGTIAGHGYVDLGLPSGLKWATCNVGASRPEGYGDYFAWGETCPKSQYSESNSSTYDKTTSWLKSNGYIDSRGNLTPSHDAARANWGSTWRMPTKAEVDELIENTTTTRTTHNGVKGRLVTSKRNGKSIFLPAAGYRDGTSLYYEGDGGDYWSSTPFESDTGNAYYLCFYSGYFYWGWSYRRSGESVRPVSE